MELIQYAFKDKGQETHLCALVPPECVGHLPIPFVYSAFLSIEFVINGKLSINEPQ